MNNEVIFIQRILPEYRHNFFSSLYHKLSRENISVTVLYGQEFVGTVPVTKFCHEKWALRITNIYFKFFDFRLVWQPAIKHILKADLIIIEQSNSLIINYIILFMRLLTNKKVAYWGHGRNMQSKNSDSFSENLKKMLTTKVDWWFAYTGMSVKYVLHSDFPATKITNVENAIDTISFEDALEGVSLREINLIKKEMGIESENIFLYCGGMYSDKKLDFLLSACLELKKQISDVHIIFVGGGPEQHKIKNASENSNYLHYVGSKFGKDRAVYFKMSKAMLMPGLVGLSIVDSFIAGIPLFTTDIIIHSPEIDYLEHGINGFMSKANINDYVDNIHQFLSCNNMQHIIQKNCLESAKKYTLDNMVNNFSGGIIKCMENS